MLRLQNMFLVSFIPYISCFVFFFPCLLCFLLDLCTSSDMRDMLAIVFAELPWLTASCASYPGLVSTWHLDSTAWLSVIGTSPSLLCLCFAFALPSWTWTESCGAKPVFLFLFGSQVSTSGRCERQKDRALFLCLFNGEGKIWEHLDRFGMIWHIFW